MVHKQPKQNQQVTGVAVGKKHQKDTLQTGTLTPELGMGLNAVTNTASFGTS